MNSGKVQQGLEEIYKEGVHEETAFLKISEWVKHSLNQRGSLGSKPGLMVLQSSDQTGRLAKSSTPAKTSK